MAFVLRIGDEEYRLAQGETIIGRDHTAHITIEDPSVSRRHARVLVVQDVVTVEDLKSKNGVRLNGRKIKSSARIGDGDTVRLGGRELQLEVKAAPTDLPSATVTEYRAPIYRTCTSCRTLMQELDRRCPACGAEQVTQDYPTQRHWTDPAGQRALYRKSVSLRALYVSEGFTVEGEIRDLSPNGCLFLTSTEDPPGRPCDLLVYPAPGLDPVRLSGEVVRVSRVPDRRGLGLRFAGLSSDAQVWLLATTDPPANDNE